MAEHQWVPSDDHEAVREAQRIVDEALAQLGTEMPPIDYTWIDPDRAKARVFHQLFGNEDDNH